MNVSRIECTDCESDKTGLTSYSRFVSILCVACVTVNRNLTVCSKLLTCGILKLASNVCREVDEVREARLRRKKNMADLHRREKLTKTEKLGL